MAPANAPLLTDEWDWDVESDTEELSTHLMVSQAVQVLESMRKPRKEPIMNENDSLNSLLAELVRSTIALARGRTLDTISRVQPHDAKDNLERKKK